MPRRRVSVAVVPKFNALNLPGQTPSASPIPSLPALVSMMSPAFCPLLHFTPLLQRGCRWGQGHQGQETSSRDHGWRYTKQANVPVPRFRDSFSVLSSKAWAAQEVYLKNSRPFEQKLFKERMLKTSKQANKFCRVQGGCQLYLKQGSGRRA